MSARSATAFAPSANRRSCRSSTTTGSEPSSRSSSSPSSPRSAWPAPRSTGYGCPAMSRAAAGDRVARARPSRREPQHLLRRALGAGDGHRSRCWAPRSRRPAGLPPMARLELIGAFALTEPEHGSDSVSLETEARRDGDGYVLNGAKRWIGNASFADLVIVWARDEEGDVGAFVVEKGTPGVRRLHGDRRQDRQASGVAGRDHADRRPRPGGEQARGRAHVSGRDARPGPDARRGGVGVRGPRDGRRGGGRGLRRGALTVRAADRRLPARPGQAGDDGRRDHGDAARSAFASPSCRSATR